MIQKLDKARDIINEVDDETGIYEVGSILCDIDEAIGAIEDA